MFHKVFCRHSKRAKLILWHKSQMNLFTLIASSITGDIEKGDDLFLSFGDRNFIGQHNTISDVFDHYLMAAFTQFRLKTGINIKPRHTFSETLS